MAYAGIRADRLGWNLHGIDLRTGAATDVGPIGAHTTRVGHGSIDDPHRVRNGFE